jgi:hypothetical protein
MNPYEGCNGDAKEARRMKTVIRTECVCVDMLLEGSELPTSRSTITEHGVKYQIIKLWSRNR